MSGRRLEDRDPGRGSGVRVVAVAAGVAGASAWGVAWVLWGTGVAEARFVAGLFVVTGAVSWGVVAWAWRRWRG